MKIEVSNWWILWLLLFVLASAGVDSLLANSFQCQFPFGKFTLYIARSFFEGIAAIMGILIGIGLMRKGKVKVAK